VPAAGSWLRTLLMTGRSSVRAFMRGYVEGKADAETRDWASVHTEVFGVPRPSGDSASSTTTVTTSASTTPRPTVVATPIAMVGGGASAREINELRVSLRLLQTQVQQQQQLLARQQSALNASSANPMQATADTSTEQSVSSSISATDAATATATTQSSPRLTRHDFAGMSFISEKK
jgi:hypothetical protein